MFSDVWSENAALYHERLMEIHSNPPILYYGFNHNLTEILLAEVGQLDASSAMDVGPSSLFPLREPASETSSEVSVKLEPDSPERVDFLSDAMYDGHGECTRLTSGRFSLYQGVSCNKQLFQNFKVILAILWREKKGIGAIWRQLPPSPQCYLMHNQGKFG